MQSVLLYGRLLARALATGINNYNERSPQFPSWLSNNKHTRELHLVTASSGISKTYSTHQVTKKLSFGDDAYFVAGHKLADVLGVADGVGGWRSYGVDPGVFPNSLMATCERLVRLGHFRPQTPKDIIQCGYQEVLQNKAPLIGSCTACIVSLHKSENTLYTANLGDSGFLVVREGDIVHRSEDQQHYFNTPFQLSVAPPVLEGMTLSDSPDSADISQFGVEEGDVILVGTDGLFDNMNDEMILYHISKLKDHKPESVQKVANGLVNEAHEFSFDPDYLSPFAINAKASGYDITGGKPDDITVLLARVTECDIT